VIAYATAIDASVITTSTQAGDAAVSPGTNSADRRTRNFYDAEGNLQATLDAAGYLTERQYDSAGRLIHTIGYATLTASSYWTSGSLAQLRPSTSGQDQHSWVLYDGRDNVIASVDAEGYLTESIYDANGNKTQQIAYATKALIAPQTITGASLIGALRPSSTSSDQSASWSYTDADQVATATDVQGSVTRYSYDTVGQVIQTDTASARARCARWPRATTSRGG